MRITSRPTLGTSFLLRASAANNRMLHRAAPPVVDCTLRQSPSASAQHPAPASCPDAALHTPPPPARHLRNAARSDEHPVRSIPTSPPLAALRRPPPTATAPALESPSAPEELRSSINLAVPPAPLLSALKPAPVSPYPSMAPPLSYCKLFMRS